MMHSEWSKTKKVKELDKVASGATRITKTLKGKKQKIIEQEFFASC